MFSTERRAAFAAVTLLAASALAFASAEAILRTTGLAAPRARVLFGGRLLKGKPFARYLNRDENRNWVRLNNWGFHDRDREARGIKRRILFLGDSFVEALQLPPEESFVRLTGDALRAEAINGGVSGTGSAYQRLLWDEFFAPRVEVDELVLAVFPSNELEDNAVDIGPPLRYGIYLRDDGKPFVYEQPQAAWRKAALWATNRSALAHGLYQAAFRWKRTRLHREVRAAAVGDADPEPRYQRSLKATLASLKAWRHDAEGEGVRFRVVLLPDAPHYVSGKTGRRYAARLREELLSWSADGGPPLLEIDLSEFAAEEIFSFDGKTLGHLNRRGHQETARRIADWLKSYSAVR